MKLNIKKLNANAILPTYGSDFAAGLDLYACEPAFVPRNSRMVIPTGLAISWQGPHEKEYYMRIAPRSGLSVKNCIDIGAGICDFDYTGEIKICFINNNNQDFTIHMGDKIAQMVLERINRFDEIVEVKELNKTVRGDGGFGSTDLTSNEVLKPASAEYLHEMNVINDKSKSPLHLKCNPVSLEEVLKPSDVKTYEPFDWSTSVYREYESKLPYPPTNETEKF